MGRKATDDSMLKVWFAIDEHIPKGIQQISKETKVCWSAVNTYCFMFWHMGIAVAIQDNKPRFVKIPNCQRWQTIKRKK